MKNLYVGNLPYTTTDAELRAMFEPLGRIDKAMVIVDRETGRSRGYGFVEMSDDGEAAAAIGKMNGTSVNGRPLVVNEARPREGGGGGGGSSGYRGLSGNTGGSRGGR